MSEAWPALCTFLSIGFLLVLVIRFQIHAFLALLLASLALGLAGGMAPPRIIAVMSAGVGSILSGVAIILALGSILGRLLEASGGAEVIARTLINAFGEKRTSLACLVTAFLIGIPILFNVGFLLLIPIIWRLQRETGKSLLFYLLPVTFALGMTHSLVPPKPGIVGAVNLLGGPDAGKTMVQTIIFGTLLGFPLACLGWFGGGRWWANRAFITAPEHDPLPGPAHDQPLRPASFGVTLLIVTMPLLLSVIGFGSRLFMTDHRVVAKTAQAAATVALAHAPLSAASALHPAPAPRTPSWERIAHHPLLDWLLFLGTPTMALLIPTLLALYFLGIRCGLDRPRLEKIAGNALQDVSKIVFLFGAAGGFKEVIQATGAGDYIASVMGGLPLPTLLAAYLVAVMMRIALGSATASILITSGLLAGVSRTMPGQEVFLVLTVACGVTFMTQPADSGFWMVKEFGNLSIRDVLIRFNACRITMSLGGMGILLLVHALMF